VFAANTFESDCTAHAQHVVLLTAHSCSTARDTHLVQLATSVENKDGGVVGVVRTFLARGDESPLVSVTSCVRARYPVGLHTYTHTADLHYKGILLFRSTAASRALMTSGDLLPAASVSVSLSVLPSRPDRPRPVCIVIGRPSL
jgi:hypothetical protein